MKRNEHYILRSTADTLVIVPVGRAARDFPGMVTVNETGAELWELLARERTEEELTDALYEKYDAPRERIAADVSTFLRRLRLAGALVEENPARV